MPMWKRRKKGLDVTEGRGVCERRERERERERERKKEGGTRCMNIHATYLQVL